ncbi:MAG: hypothetical protein WA964_16570 [Ilumatobacter sp.]|uniref:hypothetical protein n=1 Tax=Ilumatobacter sp. TaxID=1967498 RepID=UPI003C786B8F
MKTDAVTDAVTLRSSRGGIAMTIVGLAMLVVFAIAVIALNGLGIITGAIAIFALWSTVVILMELPLSATFDASGVRRTTPFRSRRISWEEVDRLVRMRRGGARRPGSDKTRGIVALCGRRRTVLVDQTEDHDEHLRLRAVLRSSLEPVGFASLEERFSEESGESDDPGGP